MRFPLICCTCFLASFGLARWALTSPQSVEPEATATAVAKVETANTANTASDRPDIETSRDRLNAALDGDDPLTSAARTLKWLETTTLEDFRRLAENPEKFPRPYFSGFDSQFREAFYEALIERWLTLDPENGLQSIKKVQEKFQTGAVSGPEYLLNIAARIRPEMVLQQLSIENKRGYIETHTRYALDTLAKRDARIARSYLDRFSTPKTRHMAEVMIAQGVIEIDPMAVISLSQQLGEDSSFLYHSALQAAARIGPGMVRQLVSAAGDKLANHPELPELLLQNPDLGTELSASNQQKVQSAISDDLRRAADRMDPAERTRVLDSYDKLPPGIRDTLAATLACSWARTEPQKAAEWALAHAKPDNRDASENRAADQVFLRWVNTDADAALAWWRSLPPSPLRDALGSNASTFIAEQGQIDVALQMCRPQSGEQDSTIATQLAQYLTERDPAEAAAWLKTLPSELDTRKATRAVVGQWFLRSPEAVAQWIETLPASPRRDEAVSAFVEKSSQHGAMEAAEWAETLADPKLRQQASWHVYWAIRRTNPAGANEWMRTLRGVDPEWHARVLRRMK